MFKVGIIQNCHRPQAGVFSGLGLNTGLFDTLERGSVLLVRVGSETVEIVFPDGG